VLSLAAGTLVASLAAWVLLYFVFIWILVLGLAVFDLPVERIPHGFWIVYVVAAFCAVGIAWIDQWLTPNARPSDNKGASEVALDFLLAVPRMTLAVVGTLRAWLCLSNGELLQAAELLHRLCREKRVPVSGVRLQVHDPESAVRILFALQMTQVIDSYREGNEFWLRLNSLRPASLRMAPGDQELT
jgi:hypothetical protein